MGKRLKTYNRDPVIFVLESFMRGVLDGDLRTNDMFRKPGVNQAKESERVNTMMSRAVSLTGRLRQCHYVRLRTINQIGIDGSVDRMRLEFVQQETRVHTPHVKAWWDLHLDCDFIEEQIQTNRPDHRWSNESSIAKATDLNKQLRDEIRDLVELATL